MGDSSAARAATSKQSISVVVNTMGRLETLKPCVRAMRQQVGVEFDLTIVVGPRSESTRRWLSEEHSDARIIDCPLANLAVSRNLGWRFAAGDLIAYIDDDAIPLPGWIARLAESFAISPRVGAAGGFVRNHTGARWQWQYLTIDPLCNPVEVRAADYRGPPSVIKGPLDPVKQRYYYPPGTNMMFRRAALEMVGGFDETYAYAADDAELCFRLYASGWHVDHVPSAEVVHRYAPSHQRDHAHVPRTLLDTVRSFVHFKLSQGRRYYDTVTVLLNVHEYLKRMHSWVDGLLHEEKYSAADAERVHSEIDEGARDALRRVLTQCPTPAPTTVALQIPREPKPFAVVSPRSRRLRLCFVARELPPAPSGGIGIWVWTLGRELARLGHEVHLIAQGEDHATVDWVEGCWVHREPTVAYGERRIPDLSDIPEFIRDNAFRVFDTVARLEAERPFDIVCAPIWEAQGIGLRRGRKGINAVSLHTPMRTVIRTSRTWNPEEAWYREYGDPLMAAESELAKSSGLILANSISIVEEIEREYKVQIPRDRLAVVPHGVDEVPGWAHADSLIRPMRKLLFVGRFEGRKGIDILLRALPGLMDRHSDLVAELVGDNRIPGIDGKSLWERFREKHAAAPWLHRIRTPGTVDDATLQDAYRTCDVFVAPSRFESFGLIFLEAMRFGKPVVALDNGGAREIIQPDVTGILVQGDDPAALEKALDRLLYDGELRAEMGRRARADYDARFTSTVMAESVVDAFIGAMDKASAL